MLRLLAAYCCGTGDAASRRSACWADYSHVCADPSSYTPSGEYHSADETDTNTAVSCDQIMGHYTQVRLANWDIDFSSVFDCTGKHPSAIDAVHAVAAKCCASGNSVCPSDTVDSAILGGRVASAVGVVSVFAVLLGFH